MKKDTFLQCVELQLGQKKVLMEDRFYEDLAAESIDMVHLIVTIEEQTGIFIPEDKLVDFKRVQDLYDYIISFNQT